MKKMLFICAAGLLTASIASAIESANIVGYQKFQGVAGKYKFLAPNFTDVLPEVPQIATLERAITGNFSDGDEIQYFGTNGRSSETIFWYTEDGQWGGFVPDGWYDGSLNPVGGRPIKLGTSFFVYNQAAANIMVAGQVELDEVSVDITLGFNAIGNSSHIPLALDDFLFDQLNDGDEIQFFGPDGRSSETIFWYTEDGQWGGFVPDGWYDGSLNPVGASTIREPGEGFFLYTTSSGASFKVPALTLN